jgi:hypothetical protein
MVIVTAILSYYIFDYCRLPRIKSNLENILEVSKIRKYAVIYNWDF